MPLEIKELHIKVNVNASGGNAPSSPVSAGGNSGSGSGGNQEQLIQTIIERIMEILIDKA